MPKNSKIPIREKPSNVLINQLPLTTFMDALSSISVKLISEPPESIKLVAYGFQKATWSDEPYIPRENHKKDEEILEKLSIDALEGNGLPLSLELFDFVFAVSGVTRIITHQLVRTRIGATYSQQCSGDKDWRHHAVLVPRSVYHSKLYDSFKQNVLESKMLYAQMLDTMDIPILDARKILPHCLETFIYVKFNLTTLASFIKKRDCVQTQEPEMVILARKMRAAVLDKHPELEMLLKNDCKAKKCFYTKSDRLVGTSMFLPDNDHDFEFNPRNFIYQKTVHEMIYYLPEVPTEAYAGVSQSKHEHINI